MTLRVASVPSGHVYVRHLAGGPGEQVQRLPDPSPGAGVPAGQWWPPRMLEAGWVAEHSTEFDLMHIHFGFDAVSPADLTELVAALRAAGKPLVLTVHDLRNPHHREPGLHDEQLSVLVAGADALITLTEGAAAQIRRRWGREARVLPHPHVVEEPTLRRPRPTRTGFVVGVHAKSLRASMDPAFDIESIVGVLPSLPGASLRVNVHNDVMTPGNRQHDAVLAGRLHGLAGEGLIDLHVHDYFSDAQLWDYLQGLDLSVLPYRFGTHSGWLEACYDLGTVVAAPDCGFYAEQRPCLSFPTGPDTARRDGLAQAVRTAYQDRPRWRADPDERAAERAHLARAHHEVYAQALAGSVSCTS
ncbi:glycosyltransferase [Ornithinimicrobium avium]|uniref:Glycosyltransferase family 1 protein n=1 Tax=Ornithinimicrobium avium TaxID=2283195 RepID=A0A345NQV6_9MICO|nr:glycosyltransferase [Ornithinimicrobium avium]AXH97414.1 glycosyltransferase family 1 protein [Ornithinimicrobium avium]